MTTTNAAKTILKAKILGASSDKPASVSLYCWRLGLVVDKSNVRNVRACVCELRAEGRLKGFVSGGSTEVVYYV